VSTAPDLTQLNSPQFSRVESSRALWSRPKTNQRNLHWGYLFTLLRLFSARKSSRLHAAKRWSCVRRRLSFFQRRMVRYRQPFRLLLSCGLAAGYRPASNLDRNATWETAEDIEEEFSIFRPKF